MIPCLHPWPRMADYKDMRCLYCGRELALLKRLTGNGEFCSDQHKQSYHDEYNRLALSRLLQAQTKTDEGRAKKAEAAEGLPVVDAPSPASSAVSTSLNASVNASVSTSMNKRERGPALPVPIAHKPEPVATGAAGFLAEPLAMLEGPSPTPIAPSSPLSWIPGPVFPVFDQIQPLAIETLQEAAAEEAEPEDDPPLAELLELPMKSIPGTGLAAVQTPEAGSFETTAHLFPKREHTVNSASFYLPAAGPVTMPGIEAIPPGVPELCLEDSQPFFPEVFQLLVPPPPEESVEFEQAAELHVPDRELALGPPGSLEEEPAEPALSENVVSEASAEPEQPESESGIDSLKRLDSGLRPQNGDPRRGPGRRTELPVTSGPVVDGLALEGLFSAPRRPSGMRANANAAAAGGVATLQIVEPEEEAESETGQVVMAEATVPFMEQMLPLTLRIISPAKPKLVSECHPLVVPSDPQLTTTETLPLRPKMGVGKPPTPEPASKQSAAVKVKPVKDGVEAVAGGASRDKKEKPFDPREAVLAVKRSINVPENKPSARKAERLAEPDPKVLGKQPATAATPTVTGPPAASEPTPATTPRQTAQAPQVEEIQPVSSAIENSAPPDRAAGKGSAAESLEPAAGATDQERPAFSKDAPANFELHLGMPERPSGLSTLPLNVKIGIAVGLLLVIAGGYFIYSGSSKSKPSSVTLIASPMTGEGGWITDWAGDSTGNHKGRKISVYRPSVSLTNYQFEFQGRIESNSIGWVFRASNASNFYAIKLTGSGTGYRLLKYAVVDGKERETGQVPIRPVNGNTFPIRVEVWDDRFTTFIGGNPVDIWVDGQLKSGGLGFLTDRGDRAEITKVGFSLLPGSAN